ncbi:hypothetical protein NY08_1635 [Rhodococcus sp. B7740]|nr:hypothetical protein NY08_1635 [Rhodococcus sp. B7740]
MSSGLFVRCFRTENPIVPFPVSACRAAGGEDCEIVIE